MDDDGLGFLNDSQQVLQQCEQFKQMLLIMLHLNGNFQMLI